MKPTDVHGTITFQLNSKGSFWVINCTGHVKNLFKRVFPNVSVFTHAEIKLLNNPENCRDLLWFIDRYPMSVDKMNLLTSGAKKHVDMELKVRSLLTGSTHPDDFELALPPRSYQSVAASLCDVKKGLLLGDDVGLGKSVSSICPLSKNKYLPALVVTLTHLPNQWAEYLDKFAPQLKHEVIKTSKPYELVEYDQKTRKITKKFPDVVIMSYSKIASWAYMLEGKFKYVIWDEIQDLRREDSEKYRAATRLSRSAIENTGMNMGLSATPIYNYGSEFFNVVEIVQPGSLGTKEEFLREHCHGEKLKDPTAFGAYLREEGILLSRSRRDVGRELPPVNRIPHSISCDPRQFDGIQSAAIELAKTILKANQASRGEKFLAGGEFNVMMRHATGVAKAKAVAEFVKMLLEKEEKVVLYGWHKDVYKIWTSELREFNPVLYTGDQSAKEKHDNKNTFINNPHCKVMIISLRAGAGLDGLQDVCRTAVFGELDWSAGVHTQCIGRLDREASEGDYDSLGPVFAYFLIADEGTDPVMVDILGIKQTQIDDVMIENPDVIEELEVDPDHIKKLAEHYLKSKKVKLPSENGWIFDTEFTE